MIEERQQRLLEAIETAVIELDETTQRRAQQLKAAREALFIEQAGVRRDASLPAVECLKASQVNVFGKIFRQKLLAAGSPLAKSYLNILVDEIVVQDKTATIRGSLAALAGTMQAIQKAKVGNSHEQVPTFDLNWCAGRDSNS
jgi:site-specific DNA recombinase